MEQEINGTVSAISQKFFGGIKLKESDSWYNGIATTRDEIIKLQKGYKVTLYLNDSGKIKSLLVNKNTEPIKNGSEYIKEASEDKIKSIATGYATQMYNAEISVLVPKCTTVEEAVKVIKSRKNEVGTTATSVYNLICSLGVKEVEEEYVE